MSLSRTKKELLAKLLEREGIADKDWRRIAKQPPRDRYSLSDAQRRIWFIEQLQPGNAAYNVPVVLHLNGKLDAEALQKAFASVIERHAALRTRFTEIEGEPFQIIEPRIDFKLAVEDARSSGIEQVREEIRAEGGKGFNLEEAGLFRVRIWQTNESEYEMLVVMHHIITDGWSMGILVKHLAAAYENCTRRDTGRELPSGGDFLQYTDYAEWQTAQNREHEKQLDYWQNKLAENLETGEFPPDFERPPQAVYAGKRFEIRIEKETVVKLKEIARGQSATLYMTLAAALKILLWRYSGEQDVALGSPAANRRRGQTDEIIGFFVNNLVIYEKIRAGAGFNEYLLKIKQSILEAFANQDVPFERLVEIVQPQRRHGVNPLFQTVFNWQESIIEKLSLPGLEIQTIAFDSGLTRFDMEFHLTERADGEVSGYLIANSALYAEESCRRLVENFRRLLGGIAADAGAPIHDLPCLTANEKEEILRELVSNTAVYPSEKTLKQLFEEQVKRKPDAVCLKLGGETLSYAEVNDRANQVAGFLLENGAATEDFVGLSAGRSFQLIIGMLGIIKAGGVYVPLDESYPDERLKEMVAETGIKTVLTGGNASAFSFRDDVSVKAIDEILAMQSRSGDPDASLAPENLAYVMFTSGSTGKPKGVSIAHRAVARLAINNNFAKLDETEVFLLLAPVSFDASTLEIWGALLNGALLAIMPPGIPTPEALKKEIEANGVTTLWLTSGLFNLVMDRQPSALRGVGQLLAGGDVLSSENVHEFLRMFPDATLINGYGPTENTTFSCCFPMHSGKFYGKNIPIGFPIANSEVYILDARLNLLPRGAVGETYVGGDGLARGYQAGGQLTAENFVPHPFSEKPGQRLYKTGDLGRFRNDGSIEFRGRKDKQVKIRGYRIEPAEIEAALMKHPAVRDAVVITSNDADNKSLLAFVAGQTDATLSARKIRRFLQKRLPDYMIPSEIFFVSRIPLTENGKVDRKELLSLRKENAPEAVKAPADEIEREINNIWSEVLDGKTVGTEENFFEVGGHSLAAVKVVSKSNSHFNLEIPLQEFFENPTIAALGDLVRRNITGTNEARRIAPLKRDSYRMSYSQRRIWFIEQLQPGNAAYNVPVVLHLNGKLDAEALQKAFASVIERHAALRTRFTEIEGEPFQIIEPRIDFKLAVEDAHSSGIEQVREEIRAEGGKGFNLEEAGLFRVRIWQTNESEYEMLVVMHHIITDGWSMGILVKHLAAAYENCTRRDDTPDSENSEVLKNDALQYGDYAEWQVARLEGGKLAAQIAYWKEELKDAGRAELPADYVRPLDPSFDGGQIRLDVDAPRTAKLKRIAGQHGATLYMTLAAALKILLWRYSGEQDVALGSPAANRESEETAELVGFFVNTLVIRSRVEPEKTFSELLAEVKNKSLKAFANQAAPFEKLVEIIQPDRDLNSLPLFQVMLILQNFPVVRIDLPGLEIAPVEAYSGKAKLDLVFNLREENGRLCGNIEYAAELFKRETVERLARQFTILLDNVGASPDAVVADLSLMSDEETRCLLEETALTDEFGGEYTVHGWFEKAAAAFPSEICAEHGDRVCDYASLDKRANRLARALVAQIDGNRPVAVMLGEPLDQIAAMLGVLKSGNYFVCLDAEQPAERLEWILKETAPACLITDAASRQKQSELFLKPENKFEKIILLDTEPKENDENEIFLGKKAIDALPETAPAVEIAPADLAYVVYTSGSTGKPKGIMQTHRGFSQFIRWFGSEFGLAPKIRIAQWASVTYDAAYAEIFSALAAGATLCLMDSETKNEPQSVARWLVENSVTVFQTVPSFFSKMFADGDKGGFSKLKYILLAGETLPVKLVKKWLAEFPESPVLYNLYGPTESVLATFHRVEKIDRDTKSVSIGRALDGRQILILDARKRLCPYGVPGEIYIRSAYLTKGYFKRPAETARSFIANPLTGDVRDPVFRTGDAARWTDNNHIEFLGRLDSQVKIRGNRIEIEEIERALKELPPLRDAAVVAAKDSAGQLQLTAFAVSDDDLPANVVRKMLAEKLPVYMLPSTILLIEKIPLTPSGKPDRIRLAARIPELPRTRQEQYVAPQTSLEKELVALWEKLLEAEKIGIADDFFQLGGHSLLAAQIVNQVRREYETEISLRRFLMNPTIGQLAKNIELSKQFSGIDPQRLAELVEKVKSLTNEEVAALTKSLLTAKNMTLPSGASG